MFLRLVSPASGVGGGVEVGEGLVITPTGRGGSLRCSAHTQNVCHFGNCAMCNVAGLAGRAAGIRLPANPVSRRAASGQAGRETGRRQPSSGEQVMSVSGRRHSAFPPDLRIAPFTFPGFFLVRGQKACVLYERANQVMLQIGSGVKEQIQSAFKCAGIH